jgi:23S rRNA (adenine2030-N6)-methyltransferase
MYSYQHRYHAGNFADLHKHLILLAILESFQKKDTPFCVLDAFAGEGLYDLNSKESQKNQEYLYGISLAKKATTTSHFVQDLLNIARSYQYEDQTFIYPGSPAIIHTKLRLQDRAVFIENHPQAYGMLKKHFNRYKQINIHKRDALEAINALLPFKEKRGLIFIDPSYEVKEEYKIIGEIIQKGYQKFSQGVYMLWYPLLMEARHAVLLQKIQHIGANIWNHEWKPKRFKSEGMYGSGVIILNPPWQFEHIIQDDLKFLYGF